MSLLRLYLAGELCVIKECVLASRGILPVFSIGGLSFRDFGTEALSIVVPCGTAIEEAEIRLHAFTVLLEYGVEIRRVICTTDSIESINPALPQGRPGQGSFLG